MAQQLLPRRRAEHYRSPPQCTAGDCQRRQRAHAQSAQHQGEKHIELNEHAEKPERAGCNLGVVENVN